MAKIHTTVAGDTFDILALRYLGHEKFASAIIQANLDYCDVLVFDAGVRIIIPNSATTALPETLPPWRRST